MNGVFPTIHIGLSIQTDLKLLLSVRWISGFVIGLASKIIFGNELFILIGVCLVVVEAPHLQFAGGFAEMIPNVVHLDFCHFLSLPSCAACLTVMVL